MAATSRFIRPIIEFFFPSASPDTFLIVHSFIRKTAHFTEYAILAFWAVRAFAASSMTFIKNGRFWMAMILVVLVAATDEFHQSFESSRTSSIYDVMLDATGGIFVSALLWLLRKRLPLMRSEAGHSGS